MPVTFKKNEYKKFVNRLRYFTELVGEKPYALVGSGSCAEKIEQVIRDRSWTQPVGIYDHHQIGKQIGSFSVEPLHTLTSEFVLIASVGHESAVRERLSEIDAASPKYIAAFSEFSEVRSRRVSQHPILINALPKSGSYYIQDVLERSLDLDHQGITEGPWPDLEISESELKSVLNNCRLSVSHLKATPWTKELLTTYGVQKVAVHVRDPRQAMVSWIHYLDKIQHVNRFAEGFFTVPDYFSLSFALKVEYHLKHFLPEACEFIEQWLDCQQRGKLSVLFLDFSQMRREPERYFERVFDFFEVEKPNLSLPPRESGLHYRKGAEDEWRSVLTIEQQASANAVLSDRLKETFQWSDILSTNSE